MKISACYIVKNEEKVLSRSLESVREIADEIIVVDTGSEDRTIEIAQEFGAKIFSSPWNSDFSTPRNLAIDHASGDWIVFLDADEFFTDETRLNITRAIEYAIEDRVDALLISLVNIDVDKNNEVMDRFFALRIFKRDRNIRFFGRIHEQLKYRNKKDSPVSAIKIAPELLTILHTGYSQKINRAKAERNLQLLINELRESDSPESLFPYITETYAGLGDYETAARFGLIDIANGRNMTTVGSKSYRVLMRIFFETNHWVERYAVTKLAVRDFPEIPEFYAELGESYVQLGQIEKAIETLKKSLKVWEKYDPNKYTEQSAFSDEAAKIVRDRIKFLKSKLKNGRGKIS